MIINEDFWDNNNKEIDKLKGERTIEVNVDYDHSIFIDSTTRLATRIKLDEVSVRRTVSQFSRDVKSILEISPIIYMYEIFVLDSNGDETAKCETFDQLTDYNVKKYYEDVKKYQERLEAEKGNWIEQLFILYTLRIDVKFNEKNAGKDTHYREFAKFFENLVHLCGSDRYIRCDIKLDGTEIYTGYNRNGLFNLKRLYLEIFSVDVSSMKIMNDLPQYSYTGDAKLSESSKKHITDFKFGNYLFCDLKGGLCSQAKTKDKKNRPVAICVSTEFDDEGTYGIFIGLNYLSMLTPDSGVTMASHMMLTTTRYKSDPETIKLPVTTNYDGLKNTQILYDFMNKEIKENGDFDIHWKRGILSNEDSLGYFPALSALYRYRTPGTKQGQWFIPSIQQLIEIKGSKKKMSAAFEKLYNLFSPLYHSFCLDEVLSSTIQKSGMLSFTDKLVGYIKHGDKVDWTPTNNGYAVIPFLKVRDKD